MDVRVALIYFAFVLRSIHGSWDDEVTLAIGIKKYTLTCPTKSDSEFVIWYKVSQKGVDVELEFSNRYNFPSLNGVEIRSIALHDAGLYKCKDLDGKVIRSFKINVIGKKKKVKVAPPTWILLPNPYKTVSNKRIVVIPCRAKGTNVVVKAYRIYANGSEKLLPDAGVVLHRPKATDSGKYRCEATNAGGKKVHDFQLVVRQNGGWSHWTEWSECAVECGYGLKTRERSCTKPKPANGGLRCSGMKQQRKGCRERSCLTPKLVKFGFDMTGPNLILTCAGKGIPLPSVHWKFEGRELDQRYKPRSNYTVIPKRKARSGSYSCTLRNSAGYFTMYLTVEK